MDPAKLVELLRAIFKNPFYASYMRPEVPEAPSEEELEAPSEEEPEAPSEEEPEAPSEEEPESPSEEEPEAPSQEGRSLSPEVRAAITALNASPVKKVPPTFKLVFLAVLVLTALSGLGAIAIAFTADDPLTPNQQIIFEMLNTTWKIGIGAIFGMIQGGLMISGRINCS